MAKYHITPSGRMMICKAWKQENCWYKSNPHVEAETREEAQKKMDEVLPEWLEKQKQEAERKAERERIEREMWDKVKAINLTERDGIELMEESDSFLQLVPRISRKRNGWKEVYDEAEKRFGKKAIRDKALPFYAEKKHQKAHYSVVGIKFEDGSIEPMIIKEGQEIITETEQGKYLSYGSSSSQYSVTASLVLLENNSGMSDKDFAFSILKEKTGHLFGGITFDHSDNYYWLSGWRD